MKSLKQSVTEIEKSCLNDIKKADSADALETVRITYLGRSGKLTEVMSQLKALPVEDKRVAGPLLNALKKTLESAYENKHTTLHTKKSSTTSFDVTAYKPNQINGSLHLYTTIIQDLTEIFSTMGYSIVDGPEVENSYYNFTTLNIPEDHPARDMHDTFWLINPDKLLRTHTSSVQAHAMETMKPPLALFAPGRCYRNEATDASHDSTFTQGEVMLIGKKISVANLLATAQTFLQAFFGNQDLKIRVRPGYFPFVEPGLEIDGSCPFCAQKGCSICKKTGWIELLGSGLVHQNVLRSSNIDPEKHSGFAFGFGIERLAMIKYGITDIRLFHSTNLNFLSQY